MDLGDAIARIFFSLFTINMNLKCDRTPIKEFDSIKISKD